MTFGRTVNARVFLDRTHRICPGIPHVSMTCTCIMIASGVRLYSPQAYISLYPDQLPFTLIAD